LEFADPVRGGRPILSASCDEPGALKNSRAASNWLTTASLSIQPNHVALRSRTGAITIDAREQVTGKQKYAGALGKGQGQF